MGYLKDQARQNQLDIEMGLDQLPDYKPTQAKKAPKQPPTDAFMDDLFNEGWLPEVEMMFLKSGSIEPHHPGAGTYATKGFHENPASMDFYGKMHQWLRKQELGADYQGLMHPKLRGEPGPAPKK